MDASKLEKMKVAELRNELQARGLDIKGVKAILIERLKAAIDAKTPVIEGESTEIGEVYTPSRRGRRTRSMTRSPSPSPVKKAATEPNLEPLLEEEKTEVASEVPAAEVEEEDVESKEVQEEDNEDESADIEKDEAAEDQTENDQAEVEDDEANEETETPAENGASVEKTDEKMEVDETEEKSKDAAVPKEEDKIVEKKDKRLSRKRSHSKSRSRSKSRTRDRSRSRSRSKNSRSRSPKGKRGSSPSKNIDESTNEEDEPIMEDKQFGLSWLDSDLHLSIDPVTFTSAKPMSHDIYSLVWSGARTNYGVREGKVCYEVRLAEETNVNQFKDEPYIRGLRCGFSSSNTGLLLGEEDISFAYCESGKKALNGEFIEYGKPFKLDDVIGCYLDLDSTPCTIQFTLNGEQLGTAFEFEKSILGEEDALFPHVITKGYEFIVNFADNENLLGNAVRPVRIKKVEKPRKDSVKPEEKREKKNSTSEDNWEVVDEAKMDDNETDEKDLEEKTDVKEDANTEESKQDDEKEQEKEEKPKEDEDEESKEKDEKSKDTDEPKAEDHDKEKAEVVEEKPSEENGQKLEPEKKDVSPAKKKRESRESQDFILEEVEPEVREPVVLLPDYELIALTPEENFINGPLRPESRKDCEVYILVGLPGSGKTHWALNHVKENPDKRYHTIGADNLIAKMTIDGKPRKPLHKGNWDRVYELCLNSLPSLEEIATKRRRNYILDQTNAFASAQRRKMKGFGDFKRNAVVCIPNEEELKRRNQLKTEAGNENSIRESTLNNLKASFTLPSLEFGWFDNIIYTDLKDDEAKDEVKRYNEKGHKDVEASRDKRQRRDYRQRDDRRRYDDRRRDDFRGSRWKGNQNERRGGGGSGNRWGPPSRGSSAPWRDDRGYGGGRNYDNRNNRYSSGGGGGGGGGGNGSWVNNNRNRYDDRFARSGGSGGGGGGGGGGGRYDSYGSGSRDNRDRRDRNGDGADSGSRRDSSYRSGNQRDFRSGHRDNRTEDSRGGFERSKYSSSNDGYEYNKQGGNVHNNSTSQGKWVQMQGGGGGGGGGQWGGQQQMQQHDYWGYDQSQSGYGNQQQQQQWPVNNADPRQQQQWMNWYQDNSQPQSQQQGHNLMQPNSGQQQYWSQYSYPNQGGTTGMGSHSGTDGSSKK